ncbi:14670_t:CDS:2, partial [Cetraspora pellucida]
IPNGSTSSTSIPNNNEVVVTSSTSTPNNNEAVVTSSILTPNNNEAVVTSSTSTPNNNEAVVIGNMYNTRENWIEITDDDNKKYWKCVHCHEKTYAIKTSRMHLKNHTVICPNSPLGKTPNEEFKLVTKEDVDNSIVDLGSWVSDNWRIVNIVLSFQKSGQTAEEITSVIMSMLKNYSIENKILALTIDNTATNKA